MSSHTGNDFSRGTNRVYGEKKRRRTPVASSWNRYVSCSVRGSSGDLIFAGLRSLGGQKRNLVRMVMSGVGSPVYCLLVEYVFLMFPPW